MGGGAVTEFEQAEARLLTALFIDHHREARRMLSRPELETEYHIRVDGRQFEILAADLERREIVKAFRDKDGSSLILLDHGYRPALEIILRYLDADTFEVNYQGQRILHDGDAGRDVPSPSGWMLLGCEKKGVRPAKAAAPITAAEGEPVIVGSSVSRDIITGGVASGPHAATHPSRPRMLTTAAEIATVAAAILAVAAIGVAIYFGG